MLDSLSCSFTPISFLTNSSLKQLSEDRHVAPLGHSIMISNPTIFFLLLLKDACWVEMRQISVLVFGLTRHGAQTRSKNLLHSWRTHCTTEKAIHANTTKFRSIYISYLLKNFVCYRDNLFTMFRAVLYYILQHRSTSKITYELSALYIITF